MKPSFTSANVRDKKTLSGGFGCTQCGTTTAVMDTRPLSEGVGIRRRRGCTKCGHRFGTIEISIEENWGALREQLSRIETVTTEIRHQFRHIMSRDEGDA